MLHNDAKNVIARDENKHMNACDLEKSGDEKQENISKYAIRENRDMKTKRNSDRGSLRNDAVPLRTCFDFSVAKTLLGCLEKLDLKKTQFDHAV